MGHCEWVVLYSYLGSACSWQRAAAGTRSIPHSQEYSSRGKFQRRKVGKVCPVDKPPSDIGAVLLHEVQVRGPPRRI